MANPYTAARTNYVRFTNLDALRAALEPFPIEVVEKDGRHALLSNEPDYGGWPSAALLEDDTEIEFDISELVCPHMAEGEILVVFEAGHEKLRYVWGWADAYNHHGERTSINLDEIYDLAAARFPGSNPITKACY